MFRLVRKTLDVFRSRCWFGLGFRLGLGLGSGLALALALAFALALALSLTSILQSLGLALGLGVGVGVGVRVRLGLGYQYLAVVHVQQRLADLDEPVEDLRGGSGRGGGTARDSVRVTARVSEGSGSG